MGFLRSLLIGALALALITHLWMLSDGGHPTPSGPTSGVARAIPEASAAAHDPSDQPDHSWGQMLQTCVAVLAVLLMAAWAPSLLGRAVGSLTAFLSSELASSWGRAVPPGGCRTPSSDCVVLLN